MKKSKKKSLLVLLLACLMVFGTVLGTVAWLTATDVKVNTFTVGDIDEPEEGTIDPVNPDGPEDPDQPNVYDEKVDGNIFEPYWKEDSKLVPGNSIAKDPYVGIGADSEPSYVYLNVANNFGKIVYFEISDKWTALDGTSVVKISEGGELKTYYTGGTFRYNEILTPADADGDGKVDDVWTTAPLFSSVKVSDSADSDDFEKVEDKEIVLKAFIHQAKDGDGVSLLETANEAVAGMDWSTIEKAPAGVETTP